MAHMHLPPRKNATTPTRISKQHLSPLQILLQMGFPKHRAEKALAATGNRGVQIASDWLLAHVNDPTLDEDIPREYILYACPTGPFLQQLEGFWKKSRELCGWNGAHNFTPHITLVSFFKAPDETSRELSRTLKQVIEFAGVNLERPLSLELYTSPNFMGFFVAEEDANYLKRLALQYVKDVSHSTISLEPHVKSLHLTLAYQFPSSQFNDLKTLVETLEPPAAASWELRLYSRDPRLATKQVHKVLYPHTPREPDELELRIGDYIYLNSDALQNSTDGWVEGISWLTGITGYLPENYTERTAESDAWTMQKSVQLCKALSSDTTDTVDGGSTMELRNNSEETISIDRSESNHRSQPDLNPEEVYEMMANRSESIDLKAIIDSSRTNSVENLAPDQSTSRKVYILRHGERVDFTFRTWMACCFDAAGTYTRQDLNMPKSLPPRKSGIAGWQRDSPLTNIGEFQARLTGDCMREHGVKIDHVYCSPSFRCVQTCTNILEGLRCKQPINIEPGLFEWLAWYTESLPNFMSADELYEHKFNVNAKYEPIFTVEDLDGVKHENLEQFYQRNSKAAIDIINGTTGNVLMIGHATTLDTCTRLLLGREPRVSSSMSHVMQKVPYCSMAVVEYNEEALQWHLIEPPCHPITNTHNQRFDWNILNL